MTIYWKIQNAIIVCTLISFCHYLLVRWKVLILAIGHRHKNKEQAMPLFKLVTIFTALSYSHKKAKKQLWNEFITVWEWGSLDHFNLVFLVLQKCCVHWRNISLITISISKWALLDLVQILKEANCRIGGNKVVEWHHHGLYKNISLSS